mmetsp:Transcript_13906/g.17141  ORF Transcript_13906/g.17141 Transcript_13906/m.17141 type:complete len:557 (-) Transcript_13906:79-1749(-)
MNIKVPDLALPELPDLREPLEIKPFQKVPVLHGAMDSVLDLTDVDEPEVKSVDDEKNLVFSDDETTAPDEKLEDLIQEEKQIEEQLATETIDNLLNEPITDPEAKKILGDPKTYDLPDGEPMKSELQKDFVEISKSLKDIADDKMRKYAKLSALKDYTKLYDTYKRYCRAGADLDWLNRAGWNAFIYDGDIADKDGDADKKKCGKLHRIVYDHYHKKSKQRAQRERQKKLAELQKQNPAWNDDDPWTGQWEQYHENDTKSAAKEIYHIKQFGVKLVGFIKVPEFCGITGNIDEFAFLKGKYQLKWKAGARSGQRRICEVHLEPPEQGTQIRMVVKWKEISTKSSNKGQYVMVKIDKKCAVNERNVKIDIGLARHEFFDATMRLSKMKQKYKALDEYAALDGFTQDHILNMIWNILFETKDNKDIKKILKSNSTPLRKLFNKYAASNNDRSADDELLGDDEWELFAKHIIKADAKVFKIKGSGPNKIQIYSCFNWALKLNKYEVELTFQGFEKAVLNYCQAMFRKRKGANYKVMEYIPKLNVFCKNAGKLVSKPIKV